MLPKFEQHLYKGQQGKVAVIGGSKEYTGAPYYAAISALRAGAELAHIYCPEQAVQPIKSYSPELIVHQTSDDLDYAAQNKANSYVVGPGLGRSPDSYSLISGFLDNLVKKKAQKKLLFDADALHWLCEKRALCDQLNKFTQKVSPGQVILTPNSMEFARLFNEYSEDDETKLPTQEQELKFAADHHHIFGKIDIDNEMVKPVALLSQNFFGNAIIVRKGIVDIISDGKEAYYVNTQGSKKRCGGIGDILSGVLGSFIQFKDGFRAAIGGKLSARDNAMLQTVTAENKLLSASLIACLVVR